MYNLCIYIILVISNLKSVLNVNYNINEYILYNFVLNCPFAFLSSSKYKLTYKFYWIL